MDQQTLKIIDDINDNTIRIVDILGKYNISRTKLYSLIDKNKLFITTKRKRGIPMPKLDTFNKKYDMYMEYLELYRLKDEEGYKGPIIKLLADKYDISKPSLYVIVEEMRAFYTEEKKQHQLIMDRIQTFNKYRNGPPKSKDGQLELFKATYHHDVLTSKELVVKAYSNLHFRPYYNNCIIEAKEYLKPMIDKYNVVLFHLDKWIQYNLNNKKLAIPPIVTNSRK